MCHKTSFEKYEKEEMKIKCETLTFSKYIHTQGIHGINTQIMPKTLDNFFLLLLLVSCLFVCLFLVFLCFVLFGYFIASESLSGSELKKYKEDYEK